MALVDDETTRAIDFLPKPTKHDTYGKTVHGKKWHPFLVGWSRFKDSEPFPPKKNGKRSNGAESAGCTSGFRPPRWSLRALPRLAGVLAEVEAHLQGPRHAAAGDAVPGLGCEICSPRSFTVRGLIPKTHGKNLSVLASKQNAPKWRPGLLEKGKRPWGKNQQASFKGREGRSPIAGLGLGFLRHGFTHFGPPVILFRCGCLNLQKRFTAVKTLDFPN